MTSCGRRRIASTTTGSATSWRLADDLEVVADAVRAGTTRQVLRVICRLGGAGSRLTLLDSSKGGQRESQVDDLDALIQVSDLHPDPVTFESWLRRVLDRRGDHRGVMLSTVHRVKGMEWDRVIVAGVAEGVFPASPGGGPGGGAAGDACGHHALPPAGRGAVRRISAVVAFCANCMKQLHVLKLAAPLPCRARRRPVCRPAHPPR